MSKNRDSLRLDRKDAGPFLTPDNFSPSVFGVVLPHDLSHEAYNQAMIDDTFACYYPEVDEGDYGQFEQA